MKTINDILEFVEEKTGTKNVGSETDIFFDLGCTGDDFDELIETYSERFSVDMSGYLWYFHADEEGHNIGALFFKPPYRRVKRIPITPSVLLYYANKGVWSMKYPEHKLPKRRIDIIIGILILIAVLIWTIFSFF